MIRRNQLLAFRNPSCYQSFNESLVPRILANTGGFEQAFKCDPFTISPGFVPILGIIECGVGHPSHEFSSRGAIHKIIPDRGIKRSPGPLANTRSSPSI